MAALWDDRERLLDALDRLPQTLCHHDAFRRNLVAHGDRIVALDWAFVGPGPVGAEISPLVSATLTFREVGSEQRPELERVVLASYTDGLRAAGWDGPEDQVRYGYAATSALRYGPGTVADRAPGAARSRAPRRHGRALRHPVRGGARTTGRA